MIRHSAVMLLLYVALIGSAGWLLATTPQGFIPAQDRGYVIISAQLPGAASLARTTDIVRRDREDGAGYPGHHSRRGIRRLLGRDPDAGGQCCGSLPGVRRAGSAPQEGAVRGGDHGRFAQAAVRDSGRIHHRHSAARRCRASAPAAVSRCAIQDRQGRGPELLAAANDELVAAARKAPGLTQVFSPFTANTPQLFVDIDRVKAQKLGVPIASVNETIQTYFGSTYVNDFNLFGRTYHVTGTGRPAVPEGERPIWRGCAPATPPATW